MAEHNPNNDTRFKAFFFLNFLGNGVFIPYMGLFLMNKGFQGAELGALMAVVPLVKIFAQTLWGYLSDLFQIRKKVLALTLLALCAASALLMLGDSLVSMLALIVLYAVLDSAYIPLSNALALHHLERTGRANHYGQYRLWGSIGFIISSLVIGFLFLDRLVAFLPLVYGLVMASAGLVAWLLPDTRSGATGVNWLEGLKIVPRRPILAAFLLGAIFLGAVSGIMIQYVAVYLREIASPGWLIGVAIALQAVPEIPLMARTNRIMQHFGMQASMAMGILAFPLRSLGYILIRSPFVVLPVQLLHGVSMVSMLVVAPTFVNRLLPDEWKATGQGLYATAFSGIGMSAGLFAAGMIYEAAGISAIWWFCIILSVVGMAIVLPATRRVDQKAADASD